MTKSLESIDKESALAGLIQLPESTVKGAKIPNVMLDDLFDRAQTGKKISKYVRNGGLLTAAFAAVAAVPGMMWAASQPEIGAFIAAALVLDTALKVGGVGLAVAAVGHFMDRRRSIRKTVNDLALGRLAELDQQGTAPGEVDRQAPTPKV